MTMKKFITMDLKTGKKVLQTIEASFIKFSDNRLPDATNLDAALKAEITRALAAEKVLTDDLADEVARAERVEATITALIGDLGNDASVKAALTRIEGLISALTTDVTNHIADNEKHITADERTAWNKAVTDVAKKADQATMTSELGKKVATDYLMDSTGKIKTAHLPSIAINSVETVASTEAAMQLTIENGDVVIINPDAPATRNTSTVVKGTFICVDITKNSFEERFRQLYSNADSISKAEVTSLIKVETDRAEKVENGLIADIAKINDGDDVAGSIKHEVRLERERAKFEEWKLDQRLSDIEPTVEQLAGGEAVEGSAANLANKALTKANKYTDEEITKVKSDATTLSGKVSALETTVGNDESGLVKHIADLQAEVDIINGDEHQEGSIDKALADAKTYADTQVANEKTDRKAEDKKLSDRIESLEANENLSIKLGCDGVVIHDLLAIRAGNNVVKAELSDSNVVGIVTRAAGPNSKTVVSGRVNGFTDLIPGQSYYLGSNGQITDKMPTATGQHIIKVGVALTATDLFVNIQEAIEIRD